MKEREIFANALQKPSDAERSAYLNAACGEDFPLRQRVEALLREKDDLGGFLESPLPGLAAAIEPPPIAEHPGQTIGRYKLLEQIGEGGMGIVYMAEQREPMRRKVALKIIKPGMDTRAVVDRFEAERQTLALMDHPNIAKVLDGGSTESGRPYFVMELVQGIPITEYCDRANLTTRKRLALFVLVCQAVHHAHQKGIIHRDVKPSNVLVTLHDGVPVPKIIDFGVAKAIDQPLTEKSVFTGHGQMIGSPLYMSPEQAEMSGLDVDTRSDIYSLGVLLYELLTGSTPFDRDRLRAAGFDEVRRVIREEEPPRPSHRLSTLDAEAISTVTVNRGVDSRRLGRQLRGDLDWIVMKALEKDRTRRYESASALAADIERHVAHEPIEARPPTLADRAAKWARRHRPAVWSGLATLIMAFVVLVVGAILILGAYQREKEARQLAQNRGQEAEENAAKAEENASKAKQNASRAADNAARAEKNYELAGKAVEQMLFRIVPGEVGGGPKVREIRRRLSEDAVAFYSELIKLNPQDPNNYTHRAEINSWLGRRDAMRADYQKALEFAPQNAELHANVAGLYLSSTTTALRDPTRGLEYARRAVELEPRSAENHLLLGRAYGIVGRHEDARAEFERFATLFSSAAWAHQSIAYEYWFMQDPGSARQEIEKAIALDPSNCIFQCTLAELLAVLGEDEKALAAVNKAIQLDSKHKHGTLYFKRGCIFWRRGEFAAALDDWNNCLRIHPAMFLEYAYRAKAHLYFANYAQALEDLTKAADKITHGPCSLAGWIPLQQVATCPDERFRLGIFALADKAVQWSGDSEAYCVRARLHAAFGRREEALADFDKARQLDPTCMWLPREHPEAYVIHFALLHPGVDARDYALTELRVRLRSKGPIDAPWLRWVSHWLPLMMRREGHLPGTVFASELRPARSTCGAVEVGNVPVGDPAWLDGTVPIAQLPYSKGIWTQAFVDGRPADFVLDVAGRKFTTLRADVGPCDDSTIRFQVLVDGKLAHQTQVSGFGSVRPISVDLSGGREIVLRVLNGGGNTRGSAGWGYARFLVAGAEDPLEEPGEIGSATDANAAFFLAEVHWRLDQKDLARRWFDKAAAWMDKNKTEAERLRPFRAEAAQLLGVSEKAPTAKEKAK